MGLFVAGAPQREQGPACRGPWPSVFDNEGGGIVAGAFFPPNNDTAKDGN